jgi:hypothetical protein
MYLLFSKVYVYKKVIFFKLDIYLKETIMKSYIYIFLKNCKLTNESSMMNELDFKEIFSNVFTTFFKEFTFT